VIFLVVFAAVFLLLWGVVFAVGPLLERLLARTAHRLASFRYHDYLPVFALLAAGVLVTMAAGDAFLDVAENVQANSPRLHALDRDIHDWAAETRTPGATVFLTTMTLIGTPAGLGVIVAVVVGVLVVRGRRHWAGYLVVTCVLGGLMNLELKRFFARARPDLAEALRRAHGYSFPSGHAMGSTIAFGAMAYLAFRVLKRWRYRAAAIALAGTIILSISFSRIYLGVHWVSDVGAGIAVGLVWLLIATVAYETFRRIRLIRSIRATRKAA
jgi:membrane-associated phospholipid phosphatase